MLEESPTHWLSGVPSEAPCGHHSSLQSVGWLQQLRMSEFEIDLILKNTTHGLITHQADSKNSLEFVMPVLARAKTSNREVENRSIANVAAAN